ncbi:MAG: hypothetical protein FJX99_02130 [Bacteroidetes bacterium]|jgi:hypothetical protein|nr:hypothetical protein [Bacteroidota bacterium]
MKKIIFIGIFFCLSFVSYSQYNLQLNQVINLEFTSSGTTVTVPTGKVWKIENCLITSINNYACMVLNGTTYYLRQHNTSSSAWDNFPYWIGEGKTVTFGGNCSPGVLSILEFNLVP